MGNGYKLFRLRKNGTLGSLFINRKAVIPTDTWLLAEDHPTKGYKHRMGWHILLKPVAPHLSEKGRVWMKVEYQEYETIVRPDSQGGRWVLARQMRVIGEGK